MHVCDCGGKTGHSQKQWHSNISIPLSARSTARQNHIQQCKHLLDCTINFEIKSLEEVWILGDGRKVQQKYSHL